jgi:hypothetical protein
MATSFLERIYAPFVSVRERKRGRKEGRKEKKRQRRRKEL